MPNHTHTHTLVHSWQKWSPFLPTVCCVCVCGSDDDGDDDEVDTFFVVAVVVVDCTAAAALHSVWLSISLALFEVAAASCTYFELNFG